MAARRALRPSRPPAATVAPRWAVAWLLALLLVCAQGIGLAHRVVHGASHGVPALHHDAHGPFDAHDKGDAQCRLLDQATHADALPATDGLALPWAPPLRPRAPAQSQCCAALARAYWARGPPHLLPVGAPALMQPLIG